MSVVSSHTQLTTDQLTAPNLCTTPLILGSNSQDIRDLLRNRPFSCGIIDKNMQVLRRVLRRLFFEELSKNMVPLALPLGRWRFPRALPALPTRCRRHRPPARPFAPPAADCSWVASLRMARSGAGHPQDRAHIQCLKHVCPPARSPPCQPMLRCALSADESPDPVTA